MPNDPGTFPAAINLSKEVTNVAKWTAVNVIINSGWTVKYRSIEVYFMSKLITRPCVT